MFKLKFVFWSRNFKSCGSFSPFPTDLVRKLHIVSHFDEMKKRFAVYEAVGRVFKIDLNDQILISDRLVDNPKKMDLRFLFSLPDDARARMVGLMLNDKM